MRRLRIAHVLLMTRHYIMSTTSRKQVYSSARYAQVMVMTMQNNEKLIREPQGKRNRTGFIMYAL